LVKEKEVLKMWFLELVKEVAKSYPKVECRASCEFDNLLEDYLIAERYFF
jgi:hypothetical protein